MVQHTLETQTITLPPADARLVEANLELLRAFGFELELFGPGAFMIRSLPALLADSDPADVVASVIEELEAGGTPGQRPTEERIIQRVCKLAAVKAGTVLSLEQMQSLIRQLERCESPLTCPHGRPTMIHLSSAQLAHEFRRK
jgi:DNA mismatch repair protein MutL